MTDSGYITIDKLNMYYEIYGEGEPLVLLHGGGSGINATFGRILDELAKTHKVIAFEQQGHGHTADIDRPFSLEQMAEDTATALEKLHIESADVFGFSNGGHVAMHLAIKHPDKVKKLVLASTFFNTDGVIPALVTAWNTKVNAEDMPETLRNDYLNVAPNPENLQSHVEKSQAMMRSFHNISEDKISKIKKPTLVMIGDQDVVLAEHALKMARLIQDARLAILPGNHGSYIGELSTPLGVSHLPQISASLVNEFLDGLAL
jgi:pimeloyl-ACP methyl ester carboxylesterase